MWWPGFKPDVWTMLNILGVGIDAQKAFQLSFQAMDVLLGRPPAVPRRVEARTPTIVGKVSPGKSHRKLVRKSMALVRIFKVTSATLQRHSVLDDDWAAKNSNRRPGPSRHRDLAYNS